MMGDHRKRRKLPRRKPPTVFGALDKQRKKDARKAKCDNVRNRTSGIGSSVPLWLGVGAAIALIYLVATGQFR